MRTKAQEWRRTRDSKRAEEQHCCSSKCSHFNEQGEEESLVPPAWPSASHSTAVCFSRILRALYRVELYLGEVPAGTPCAPTAEGEGLARTCSVLVERENAAMGNCSRAMG